MVLWHATDYQFQSTQPKRAATYINKRQWFWRCNFNPRSPRGLRRGRTAAFKCCVGNFNPRSPRGLRPGMAAIFCAWANFNPRSPRGLRRKLHALFFIPCTISIHAAQEGCDNRIRLLATSSPYFNPRSPRGLRPTVQRSKITKNGYFNPRSPRGLRHVFKCKRQKTLWQFQSTQPKRAATGHPF